MERQLFSISSYFLYRKLFWTDKGSDNGLPPKVASADMDGGNARILYTGDLENIGFIAADISAMKLYWGVAGSGVVCTEYYLNFILPFRDVKLSSTYLLYISVSKRAGMVCRDSRTAVSVC